MLKLTRRSLDIGLCMVDECVSLSWGCNGDPGLVWGIKADHLHKRLTPDFI